MKKGKEYEIFIEKLYKQLEPDATIVQDDYIYGYTSKTKRQIDVSIRNKFLGKDYLTIVQAKDYKKPADVNDVGAFLSVIEDVRANKGIMVCSKGFTKAAVESGRSKGVDLLTLHGAQNANWSTLLKVRVTKTIYTFDLDWTAMVGIADLANKEVRLDHDIWSLDLKETVSIMDIIHKLILKKVSAKQILKKRPQRIDLKEISLYMFINNEFRKVVEGHVEIVFESSKKIDFLMIPDDYIVEVDHLSETKKVHSAEFAFKNAENLLDPSFGVNSVETDDLLSQETSIVQVVYDFKQHGYFATMKFNFSGGLRGDFITNGKDIMIANDHSKRFADVYNKHRTPRS